jgi:isoquinoline 1-oxidoreductase beta subunit
MPEVAAREEEKKLTIEVTRRGFLRTAAVAGGGLLLNSTFFGTTWPQAAQPAGEVPLNAWLRISPHGITTIIVSQAEIGQGISTTMPALIADELGADWNRVRFENSPTDPAYRNPRINWQFTGNSESSTSFFNLMRTMGAAARQMLIQAAASRWNVTPEECATENSMVVHPRSARTISFGAVANDAAKLEPPKSPKLKERSQWELIGKSVPRVDVPSKVGGTAVFGIDFRVPGMVYAAINQSPVFGGRVRSFNADAIKGMPGVIGAFQINGDTIKGMPVIGAYPMPDAVAVVADSYWRAAAALRKLPVEFDDGPNVRVSTETLMQQYRAALDGKDWILVQATGDRDALHHEYPNKPLDQKSAAANQTDAAGEILPTIFSADYESPFMAHSTMEPMNATARVTAEGVEVWAPTQGQELAQLVLCGAFKLPKEKVRVNRTYAGGAFGRRLIADFVLQAALLSQKVGKPVKVIWSREEDMQHDIYRPATLNRITAGIDSHGRLRALAHQLVSPSILQYVSPPSVTDIYDPSCLEGLVESHYQIPNVRVDFKLLQLPVPTSVLRTTGYGPNTFAIESFIDELAYRKGQDAFEYRRELLGDDKRAIAVLDAVAEHSHWTDPLLKGHARGIAFTEAFRTIIAHVVELSVDEQKRVTIHRVICVADPGIVLDPEITRNSMEGGIAWGLTCAFKSEVHFLNGRTRERHWADYPVVTMREMPPLEVHLIDSGTLPLGGVGEVPPVTVIPAVANAIFAATGERCRSMPLKRHGYSLA